MLITKDANSDVEYPIAEPEPYVVAQYVEYTPPPPPPPRPVVFGHSWGIIHINNGVDIANRCGTPIHSYAEGRITRAWYGYNGGWGNYVTMSHPDGTETLYAHLSEIQVSKGQYIEEGFRTGLMGTTGRSTGCHLHFEVHGAPNPYAR